MPVIVGTKFPDEIEIASSSGPFTISRLLGRGPVVVAFHRMWCPFCQQAARDLAAAADTMRTIGATVVLIYRESVEEAEHSCRERGIPFHCASDHRRTLETAADVGRFSLRHYLALSPAKMVRVLREGSRIGASSEFLQGRGTFVLDRNGHVVYTHRSVTAADIPDIADVVAAAREAARDADQ